MKLLKNVKITAKRNTRFESYASAFWAEASGKDGFITGSSGNTKNEAIAIVTSRLKALGYK